MTYRVIFIEESVGDLESLSSPVRERIIRKIKWLSENFDDITPLALKGNLSMLSKMRIGDYRIIYFFDRKDKQITIQQIGHRSDVYE